MSISTEIFFKKDINVKSLTASEIWQNQTKIHHHGTNAHAAICGSQNEQRKMSRQPKILWKASVGGCGCREMSKCFRFQVSSLKIESFLKIVRRVLHGMAYI